MTTLNKFQKMPDEMLMEIVNPKAEHTKNLDFNQLMQLRNELKKRGLNGYQKPNKY